MKKVIYEKWLLYLVLGGFFLLLLTPFVITKSLYFPYVAGKAFYFRIIVEIMAVLYVFLIALNRKYLPKMNALIWVMIGLLVSLFISNSIGIDPYKSFFSNFERMEGYINIVHLVLLFVIANNVIDKKFWNYILNTSLGISFIVNLYAIFQLLDWIKINQGGDRVDGPFGNTSYLAVYSLIHVFIALFFAFKKNVNATLRYVYLALAILSSYILFATATRGAMLGLVGSLLLGSLLFVILSKSKKLKKASLIAILLIVVASSSVYFFRDSSLIKSSTSLSRLTNISLSDPTTMSRFTIWGMSLSGLKEKPIFGWGQENFNYVFNKYYEPSLFLQEEWFDRAHNVVVDWFISGGSIGGLLYLSIFVFAIWYIWKREDFDLIEKIILTSLFAGYFFQNLFVFDNPVSYLLFFLLLAFVSPKKENNYFETENDPSFILRISSATIFVIVLFYAMFVFSIKPIIANRTIINSINSLNNYRSYGMLLQSLKSNPANAKLTVADIPLIEKNDNLKDEVKELFVKIKNREKSQKLTDAVSDESIRHSKNIYPLIQKVVDMETFATGEAREQFASLGIAVIRDENFPSDEKQKIFDFVQGQMYEHSQIAYTNTRNQTIVSMFFSETGNLPLAIEYLKRALELSPKKQTILLQLGTAYMQMGETENALISLKKATDLDERFAVPKIAYAGALIFSGKKQEGKTIINGLLETENGMESVYMNDQFIKVMSFIKEYDIVLDSWKYRVARDEKNNVADINKRISLALAYFDANQKQEAIKEIETIIQSVPDFKTVGEKMIIDIRAGKRPQ